LTFDSKLLPSDILLKGVQHRFLESQEIGFDLFPIIKNVALGEEIGASGPE
jgi:hypothetical protein